MTGWLAAPESQTAPDSKTSWDYLTDEQKTKRRRNISVRNQRQNRTVARLMKQISEKDIPMCIAAPSPEEEDSTAKTKIAALNGISEKFKEDSRDMMQHVLDNFDGTYRNMLEEHLYHLLEHGVDNEKKKIEYAFKREDVKELVQEMAQNL